MTTPRSAPERTGWRRRLERLSARRGIGLLLYLAAMWIAFKITTDVAAPYVDWIDAVVSGPLTRWLMSLTSLIGLTGTWAESLLVDGVLGGVGAVLAFVPVLASLYVVLAVLEESGYLARGAHVMDGAMRLVGLPGGAFLPMMLGFGCSVPALLALRMLERPRDRVLAGLLVPFMSCGARLPVYVLLATAFFVDHRTLAVFAMYLLGLATAIVLGLILGRTVLSAGPNGGSPAAPPPLRLPTIGRVWALVKERTVDFLRDAGTVILGASLVVWLLLAIPVGSGSFGAVPVDDSAFATVSRAAAPVMEPLGLGDWRQSGSLLTGLVAKEVVVGTLAQTYGVAEEESSTPEPSVLEDLRSIATGFVEATGGALRAVPGLVGIDLDGGAGEQPGALIASVRVGFEEEAGGRGAAAGFAFMVFVLLYTPCAASLATTRRELGIRWMWVSALGQLVVAWVAAFAAFHLAVLAGLS
jgi:ferrous iron transport protein B